MRYRIDLKREREKRNMTQAKLAELIGVTEKSISKWESGRGQPSYENMLKICKAFNINIDKIDSRAIAKTRITKIINTCLLCVNLIVLIIILFNIVNNKNINTSEIDSNMLHHFQFFEMNYEIDRAKIWLMSFMIIPLINLFLLTFLRKHIKIKICLSFISILFCMFVFQNLFSNIVNFILLICLLIITVILISYYMMNRKFKGEVV